MNISLLACSRACIGYNTKASNKSVLLKKSSLFMATSQTARILLLTMVGK